MRMLHTSDWHVGKKIRGNSRHDEHVAVLGEIVDIAADNSVELVLVAGDVFESASPPPESEALVYRTLLDLADTGATVALISGNHDNARRLTAVTPLLDLGNIVVQSTPAGPTDGGTRQLDIGGTPVHVAMLPFVSQRGIVRAAQLMANPAFENANVYADRMRTLLEILTADFDSDAVNVVLAHAYVHGAATGGGERHAHVIDEYALSAQAFPASASYVALGHLHRAQRIPGAAPIHYCGSPLQLDFGEQRQTKQVNVVTVEPGKPAAVDPVTLTTGRGLRTLSGTLDELRSVADLDDDWLRVRVEEARRPDLADDVRTMLGARVVDVEIVGHDPAQPSDPDRRIGREPVELFDDYLAELGIADERLRALFAELLEDATGTT